MSKAEKLQAENRKRGRPIGTLGPAKLAQVIQSKVKQNAPQPNYFVLCNGKPVKNLKELADVMDDLEDQVFNHHVRPEHNDFAAWVADVFKDVELAKKLTDAKDQKHFQLVIYRHLTHKLW